MTSPSLTTENREAKSQKLMDTYQCFVRVFDDAKSKDEFEYCCALLRIEGMEGPGWDLLQESHTLLKQVLSLADSPISTDFRTRLLLLAYCHAIEMDFTYNIIANMFKISQGETYCSNWFDKQLQSNDKPLIYPLEKIQKIHQWAQSPDQKKIAETLKEMHLPDVRNAFDHSGYVIYENKFRIKGGILSKRGEPTPPKQYRMEELIPHIELGINIALMLINLTFNCIQSYKENKKIRSRLTENDPIFETELITEPGHGLIGFQSIPKQSARS